VFVGKPGAAAEDAGWLLTLVYDAAAHESHVAVMDAERVSDGPVARAYFGHAVPFTFHGFFQRA
jgi:all-trans-8'-apo-beta-carotenal 15,15'-oxygenase